MNRTLLSPACAAALLALALPSLADIGPGLYVSEDGEDSGLCTDVASPCRTIGYALQVAGKNTRIHVAVGTYEFSDPQAILYAMSGAVHVHGGYVTDDQGQWIKGGKATLTSVPFGYRDFFAPHGFIVVADAKGDEGDAGEATMLLDQFRQSQRSSAAVDCVGGMAAGFACNNVDILSHVARQDMSSTPMKVADIWGFVDLNTRREYVIVGVGNGTAVFDVADPEAPREVGFVGGLNTTWRDIKVLQLYDSSSDRWHAYAYVTADGVAEGLVVIDLGDLPHGIRKVPYTSDFLAAHNVYLTDTDYSTGLALPGADAQMVIAGSSVNNGQFRSYSLANPAAPAFTSTVSGAGYMHDAASLRITDGRATQCGAGGTECNVLLDFNEVNVELWDVTDASAPSRLAIMPEWAQRGYVHSGWWTEDRQFVLAHDELDEGNFGFNTKLRVVSIASLTAPFVVGEWNGPTRAIDHNGFVRGNRYYMSNYTRGLTILDLTNPASPVEVGFFDTYPIDNNTSFSGAWGAYPYLPSGVVAVSDINSGLYLLRDGTRDVAAGRLAFANPVASVTEGGAVGIAVSRSGGASGSVSVDWEFLPVSASGSDLQSATGTLTWSDGDTTDRMIDITAVADAETEALEEMIIRLVNPGGGATLGTVNMASLFVADAGVPVSLELLDSDVSVAEQGLGLAVVTVRRLGSAAGSASVDFVTNAGSATAGSDYDGPANGTLTWADGDALPKTLVFDIAADAEAEADENFDVVFSNAVGGSIAGPQTANVVIRDGSGGNTAPVASAGGNQTRTEGTNVMLNGTASFDPDGDALTYSWTQETGPTVTLNNASSDSATFVAPAVSNSTTMRFRLDVSDGAASDSATTVVTVVPRGQNNNGGGSGSGAPSPLLLLAVAMLGIRRLLGGRRAAV